VSIAWDTWLEWEALSLGSKGDKEEKAKKKGEEGEGRRGKRNKDEGERMRRKKGRGRETLEGEEVVYILEDLLCFHFDCCLRLPHGGSYGCQSRSSGKNSSPSRFRARALPLPLYFPSHTPPLLGAAWPHPFMVKQLASELSIIRTKKLFRRYHRWNDSTM